MDAREEVLTSADGTAFAAYLARAAAPGGPGIVIIPDVRGLHPFYEELARRLAEAGVHAIALDLYARTAGPGLRGADFEYMPHVNPTERATIRPTWRRAWRPSGRRTAALPNARTSWASASVAAPRSPGGRRPGHRRCDRFLRIAGRSGPREPAGAGRQRRRPTPARCSSCGAAPTRGIPPEVVAAFDERSTAAGVEHRLVSYPGAPHSFFDRTAAEHADAADRPGARC